MRVDPDEVIREIQQAFEQVRPDGPFLGHAQGVEIEVDLDGEIVDVAFAGRHYRVMGVHDLGVAIVSAHRKAREAAIAAKQQAILDTLDEIGVDTAGT